MFIMYSFMSASKDTQEMSRTFVLVFVIMWLGGVVITINGILLGAKISLFQVLCVLGYCLFPVLMAAIINEYLEKFLNFGIKVIIAVIAFVWSCFSSISFMGDIVGHEKKGLSLFPICLFYFAFTAYLLL